MSTTYFKYTRMNNIHKFVMFEVGWNAMDAYFGVWHEIMKSLEVDEPLLMIMDFTQSGFPSLHLNIVRGMRVMRHYNMKRINRTLAIHNDPYNAQIARITLSINPFIHVKFIRPDDEDLYIRWLQTGDFPGLAAD